MVHKTAESGSNPTDTVPSNPERRKSHVYAVPSRIPNSNPMHFSPIHLCDCAQELRLQNKLPLLILLRTFIRLIVLPAHRLLALPAMDISNNVPACRHVTLAGLALGDVDDGVEEVGFAVLAAEVLLYTYISIIEIKREVRRGEAYTTDDIIMITQMRLTTLAPIDPRRIQIDVVREAHGERLRRGQRSTVQSNVCGCRIKVVRIGE